MYTPHTSRGGIRNPTAETAISMKGVIQGGCRWNAQSTHQVLVATSPQIRMLVPISIPACGFPRRDWSPARKLSKWGRSRFGIQRGFRRGQDEQGGEQQDRPADPERGKAHQHFQRIGGGVGAVAREIDPEKDQTAS